MCKVEELKADNEYENFCERSRSPGKCDPLTPKRVQRPNKNNILFLICCYCRGGSAHDFYYIHRRAGMKHANGWHLALLLQNTTQRDCYCCGRHVRTDVNFSRNKAPKCPLQCSRTFFTNHTLARWCESVLKATKQVNGKGQNSTPRHTKTP